MSEKRITYTSENGYTGILYGHSSLAIINQEGREVMHTGSRNFHTYDELVDFVETFPEFYKMLMSVFENTDEKGETQEQQRKAVDDAVNW